MGMAGMISWNPHHAPRQTRVQGNLHGSPTPPMTTPSPTPMNTTPRTPSAGGSTKTPRIPNIPMGQHWKQDEENYDNQKVNGLVLPRTIRASSWSQLKDIEGCDPLTVPLSKLLYQGSENFWLRKLATGREIYVATMGEVNQVVLSVRSFPKSEVVDLTWIGWLNTKHYKMTTPWRRKRPSSTSPSCLWIKCNDGLLLPSLIQVLNAKSLNYKQRLLLWKLLQTLIKIKIRTHQLKMDKMQPIQIPIKIEYSHLLKPLFKGNDQWLLILPNYWSHLVALTSGWKTTFRSPSVNPNISHGSKTSSLTLLPDKPLRETLLPWTIGGKTNQKKLKQQSIEWQFVQEYLLQKSSLDTVRTSSRSSQLH